MIMLMDGPSGPLQKGTYVIIAQYVHSYQLFHDGLLVVHFYVFEP